jgi:hypothetical protein
MIRAQAKLIPSRDYPKKGFVHVSESILGREMPMTASCAVSLILVDGIPSGVIRAEIGTWVGRVYAAPRARLAELIGERDARRAGIYLLEGADPDAAERRQLYVGESERVGERLRQHLDNDDFDFAERAAFVVTKDDSFSKTIIRALEAELIRLANRARAKLANGTRPPIPSLSEADRLNVDEFRARILIALPLLGFDLFRPLQESGTEAGPVFELRAVRAEARARETDDGFLVLEGSLARKDATSTLQDTYQLRREQLRQAGKLVDAGSGSYRFAADVLFPTPSAAASVVAARSASGPQEWKLAATGESYRAWRAQRLPADISA